MESRSLAALRRETQQRAHEPVPRCSKCGGQCTYCRRRHNAAVERLASPLTNLWRYLKPGDPAECWDWEGTTDHNGYGMTSFMGVNIRATHVALLLRGIEIEAGEYALHSCDRPICCNPYHLSVGTAGDNARDAVRRKRHQYGAAHWTNRMPERIRAVRGKYQPLLGKEKAAVIKARLVSGASPTALAREYGVRKWTIQQIKRGETYKDVPWPSESSAQPAT